MIPDPAEMALIVGLCVLGAALVLVLARVIEAAFDRRARQPFMCPNCHGELERKDGRRRPKTQHPDVEEAL